MNRRRELASAYPEEEQEEKALAEEAREEEAEPTEDPATTGDAQEAT